MATVQLLTSQYGNPQPTLSLEGRGLGRKLAALTYEAAAVAERLSVNQYWIVVPDPRNGIVYLELLTGSDSEVAAGMDALNVVLPHLREV